MSHDGQRARARAAMLLALTLLVLFLLFVLGAGIIYLYDLWPSPRPADASIRSFERLVEGEASKRWSGRVVVSHVDAVRVRRETDLPPHEYSEWSYLVLFSIKSSGARFAVAFPTDVRWNELRDWGMFDLSLSANEIRAMQAYQRLGGPPVIDMDHEPSQAGAKSTIWTFSKFDPNATDLLGGEVVLRQGADGRFESTEE